MVVEMKDDLKFFYADYIDLPLPEGHRFPHDKYQKTREYLKKNLNFEDSVFRESPLASYEDLIRVHDKKYVDKVFSGDLNKLEQRKIGFPWSKGLVNRVRASTGGTLAAAIAALETGYSAQLAGGTHHAHYDFGAGYCVFNDFAFTTKMLRQKN